MCQGEAPAGLRLDFGIKDDIAEARARIFALSPEPRPLPPGKTLEDVIVGQWPGDETDEEFEAIMRDLS